MNVSQESIQSESLKFKKFCLSAVFDLGSVQRFVERLQPEMIVPVVLSETFPVASVNNYVYAFSLPEKVGYNQFDISSTLGVMNLMFDGLPKEVNESPIDYAFILTYSRTNDSYANVRLVIIRNQEEIRAIELLSEKKRLEKRMAKQQKIQQITDLALFSGRKPNAQKIETVAENMVA